MLEGKFAANECPYANCIELADTPHAHNTLFGQVSGSNWTNELLAAAQVVDLARDPADFRVTRQSKVTIGGLLVPVSKGDREGLDRLFARYQTAFERYQTEGYLYSRPNGLTATMDAMMRRCAARAKETPDFSYISIDPRDYTTFSAPSSSRGHSRT